MECSKNDWKLFRTKIAQWQENYMDRLNKEYIELLSGEGMLLKNFGNWKNELSVTRNIQG